MSLTECVTDVFLLQRGDRLMGRDDDYDRLLGGLSEVLAEPERTGAHSLHLAPPLPLRVPDVIEVAAIRQKTGLSQMAFARRIGVPVATLRNWEQGHRSPQGPARVLLALLDRNPKIVEETLAD
jgi:putative transcriptional regulator